MTSCNAITLLMFRNIDHFFFLDVEELEASSTEKLVAANATAHQRAKTPYGIFGRSAGLSLRDELKKDFGEMPGPAAIKLKDYAVVNVGASVIPTYLPGVRVYSWVESVHHMGLTLTSATTSPD